MLKTVCFDLGYRMVKTSKFMFPAVVGNARTIRFNLGMSSQDPLKNLEVEVEGKKYFVGELAVKQSDQHLMTLKDNRFKAEETKVLLETALGLLLNDRESANVVTGLPLDYLIYQKELEELLIKKKHHVVINGEEKRFDTFGCVIIPQPVGAYFYLVLDDKGKIADKSIARSNVGIVDIGFGTTDIVFIDSNMNFIDKYSRSKDIAINSMYKMIADNIYNAYGVDKDFYEIEDAVMHGIITIKGKNVVITDIIQQAKQITAQKLISWITNIWKNRYDIDKIYLAGGGSLLLGDIISKELEAFIIPDAQKSIVLGYEKLAKRIFQE